MISPVRIDFEPYRLALRRPLETAAGRVEHREGWLVRLTDREGRVGLGEIAPLSQAGTESFAEASQALSLVVPAILVEHLDASEPSGWEPFLAHRFQGLPALRAGLDLACWDLYAQQRGLPLAEALSRGSAVQVEANVLVTSLDRDLLAEQLEQGYTVFKLKVGGRSLSEDVGRVGVLREVLGGRGAIRLDANGAWRDPSEARTALLRIGVEGVEAVEQPLPPGSESLWPGVQQGLPLLAADESARDEASCVRLLEEGLVQAVVLKPARMGGLGPCLRTARLARASGARLWVTTMLEAAVGRAGCLHLAAALGAESVRPHGLTTGSLLAEDIGTPFWTEGPLLGIDPGVPGLGMDL